MASFGEELKRERELRDISLKEIAEATKISIRFLEALECNNFDILPGGIFNRGFIRAYARFIGVDGEEMVNSYLHELSVQEKRKSRQATGQAAGSAPPRASAPVKEVKGPVSGDGFFRPEKGERRGKPSPSPSGAVTGIEEAGNFKPRLPEGGGFSRSATILWAAVVIILLIGAAAVTFVQLGGGEDPDGPDVAGAGSLAPLRPQEASTGTPATRTASASENSPGPVADPPADPVAEPPADPAASGVEEPAPAQDPAPSLWVRATEFNHVRIECGDGVALDQELLPNQSRTVTCLPPGRISALNAGALQYAVDGGPPSLLGEMGHRVEGVMVIEQPAESDTETVKP